MSIREACNLVIQSTNLSNKGKIFILNMGKQILMRDIIFKLAEMKNIRKEEVLIKKIGLNKGEKLSEELSIGKQFIKTLNKDIFETNEPTYKKEKIEKLIYDLNEIFFTKNQYLLKIIFHFSQKKNNFYFDKIFLLMILLRLAKHFSLFIFPNVVLRDSFCLFLYLLYLMSAIIFFETDKYSFSLKDLIR